MICHRRIAVQSLLSLLAFLTILPMVDKKVIPSPRHWHPESHFPSLDLEKKKEKKEKKKRFTASRAKKMKRHNELKNIYVFIYV